MAESTLYVPFGDLKPDLRSFSNDGMVVALNVAPCYGNYLTAPQWGPTGDEFSAEPRGMHLHFGGGTSWYIYSGTVTALVEWLTGTITDKSRTVGGAYACPTANESTGWQFTSFGDAIIATDFVDDPQLLATPATANFVKLATTAGGTAGAGMDPRAHFAAPVKGNLFLGNLSLPTALLRPDGTTELSATTYPTYVAWSASDNARAYGSYSATPSLIGAGYQPLAYDFGHINGMIGGEYALISLQRGWVRADGPPYTFRPIVVGEGSRFPNSVVRYGDDVYFWGPYGPAVLRGGEGPPVCLGDGRVARTLTDNTSGFSPTYSIASGIRVVRVTASLDTVSGLVCWTITTTAGAAASRIGDLMICYNVRDDRFSFVDNTASTTGLNKFGVMFAKYTPDLGGSWFPERDLRAIVYYDSGAGDTFQVAVPDYNTATAQPLTLTRGFQQFDDSATTRVTRVRPIFSRTSTTGTTVVTVTVTSKQRPYDTGTATSSSTQDTQGYVTLPSSVYADFHQISVVVSGTGLETMAELEGFEVKYLKGGIYGA